MPFLSEVYSHVATVRIRNVATVGGGIAHGDPSQDPPPALIVLGAQVELQSKNGERVVSLSDGFFQRLLRDEHRAGRADHRGHRAADQPAGARTAYLEFLPRTADDYATVAVAAWRPAKAAS